MRSPRALCLALTLAACSPGTPPGSEPSRPRIDPQVTDPGEELTPEQIEAAEADAQAAAREHPTAAQLQVTNRLREEGRLRAVRWEPGYAAPFSAWGPIAADLGDDPVAAVHAFVRGHTVLLGLEGDTPAGLTLDITHQLSRRGVDHLRLQRLHDGVPLRGETLLVHLRGGEVMGFAARLTAPSERVRPASIITRAEAEARVRERYTESIRIESRLVWLETDAEGMPGPLAWEVIAIPAATGAATRFDIHATSAEVLSSELIAPTLGEVTSCVFEEKPTLLGRDDVGVSDLWVTTSEGRVQTNANGGFAGSGEISFVFEGPACNVTQRDGSRYAYSGGATADVCFDYFDSRFAEVSAFYHVNKASRIFRERYGFEHDGTQVQVTVNDTDDHFNAFARGNELWFGKGFGVFPMAVSFDVVAHEFTHFVTDTLAAGGAGIWYSQYTQVGGISEGYSDYFPASYRGDPKFNDAFQPWFGRDLGNDMVYPDDYNAESHNGGRIWGGFLWDLREALGPEVADFLAFEAIAFVPSRGDFLDGRDAVLAADEVLHGGAHATAIMKAAKARGFVDERRVYARTEGMATGFAPLTVSLVGGYSGWSESGLAARWSFNDGSAAYHGTHVNHTYRRGKFKPLFIVSDGDASLQDDVTVHSCQGAGAAPPLVVLLLVLGAMAYRRPRELEPPIE